MTAHEDSTIDLPTEIARTAAVSVVRPGDTLVLGYADPLDEASHEALHCLMRSLPGVTVLAVSGVTGMVVWPEQPRIPDPDPVPAKPAAQVRGEIAEMNRLALLVPCTRVPYCQVITGATCRNQAGEPLKRLMHTTRINDGRRKLAEEQPALPGGG